VALSVNREREQVAVAEALTDPYGFPRDGGCRGEIAGDLVPEHHREEQVATLGALALLLEEALRAPEPAARRSEQAAGGEVQADPRGAASRPPHLSRLEEPLMAPLEPRRGLLVPAEHEGTRREEVDIGRLERRPCLRRRQRLVRLEPRPSRVGLAASLVLRDSIPHAGAHRGPLYRATGAQADAPSARAAYGQLPPAGPSIRLAAPVGANRDQARPGVGVPAAAAPGAAYSARAAASRTSKSGTSVAW
jgi:hypothetical protein